MALYRLIVLGGALSLAAASLASAAPKPSSTATRVATKPAASLPSTATAHAVHVSGPIVATVNGEPITETEWIGRMRLMYGKDALDNLVHQKILLQEARKNEIVVTPMEITAKAAEFEKNYRDRFGSPAKFDDFLKQRDLTLASFRSAMRYSAEMQVIQQKLADKLGSQVQVTDKELQDLYERQKFQFSQPAEVKIAQIMINFTGLDDASQNKTKAQAQEVLDKAKAPGADFAALAKQYSQDADTKDKGGEMAWMSFSPWGPPFDQVVMAAPVGLIDQPVRSYKGYHIIKVLDKRPQRTKSFDEVKEDLKKRVTDQRRAQQFREYMQKAETSAKTDVKLKF